MMTRSEIESKLTHALFLGDKFDLLFIYSMILDLDQLHHPNHTQEMCVADGLDWPCETHLIIMKGLTRDEKNDDGSDS
jgi:hypothetical protein